MSTPVALERDDDLTAFVAAAAAEHLTPGVGVGVVVDGRALAATVGVTSTADPLPIDDATLFMVGSTSKTVTATAVLALVDAGELALTDRVVDHLPAFRLHDEEVAASVTIGHLLNHTSGWRGDLHPDTGWGDDALGRSLDAVATAPQTLPLGAMASYSNSGFLLAGHLVATVRGTTYEEAARELVLAPLGMGDSCFLPWEVVNRRHAVGHVVPDGGDATPIARHPLHRSIGPAGGMWSSVRDQLAYARYHLDGTTAGSAPLRAATRLAMQQPTIGARSTIDGIGHGWLLNHHGDVRLVAHGGNVSNLQTSTFVLAPDHGFAVTVMTNAKHGATIGEEVLGWALDHYLGIGPKPALPTVPFVADELVGVYDIGPFGWALTTTDGRLYVQIALPDDVTEEARLAFAAPPQELVAVGPDAYALAAAPVRPVLDVRRASDGTVAGIVHGMRFAVRVS